MEADRVAPSLTAFGAKDSGLALKTDGDRDLPSTANSRCCTPSSLPSLLALLVFDPLDKTLSTADTINRCNQNQAGEAQATQLYWFQTPMFPTEVDQILAKEDRRFGQQRLTKYLQRRTKPNTCKGGQNQILAKEDRTDREWFASLA